MAKYANQFTIVSGERLPRDGEHLYTRQSLEAIQRAMVDLKGETFKLWLYLSKNKDGEEWGLSPKACEAWGIKKDSYYKARDMLIEKGYLVEIGKDKYRFDEVPTENENETEIEGTVKIPSDGSWEF